MEAKLIIGITFSVLLSSIGSSFASTPENDLYFLQSIANDAKRVQQGLSPLSPREGVSEYAVEPETCFEDLGCFSKIDGPFSFLDLVPESPEKIGTEFHLYSRHNSKDLIHLHYNDLNSITTGFFDPRKQTIIICHGLNENAKKDWIMEMKDAFLKRFDVNIITVEWGNGAYLPFYGQAVVNSEVVGRQLAKLLLKLKELRGMDISNIHMLGYSLGAHVSGFVGKEMTKNGESVGRITGLDPAGPLFEDKNHTVHLSPKDATFVDIIHSSSGKNIILGDLGIVKEIGHIDYYPNGGRDQPGCGIFSITCSHRRGLELFIESLSSECSFKAYPCAGGYEAFKKGQCDVCGKLGCPVLGINSQMVSGGPFYLATKKQSPYCLE